MNSKMRAKACGAAREIFSCGCAEGWLWSGASSATFRADFSGDVGRITAAQSMSRRILPSGFDPMGERRFSDLDMRLQKNLEHVPAQPKRDVL
jgi:hypothetical protein